MQFIGSTMDLKVLIPAYQRLQERYGSGKSYLILDVQQPNGGFSIILPEDQARRPGTYRRGVHDLESLLARIEYATMHHPTKLQKLIKKVRTNWYHTHMRILGIWDSVSHREFQPLITLSTPIPHNTDKKELKRALKTLTWYSSQGEEMVYIQHPQGLLGEHTYLTTVGYLSVPQPRGSEILADFGIDDVKARLKELRHKRE